MPQFRRLTSTLAVIVVLTAAPAAAQDVWSATVTVGIVSSNTQGYIGFPAVGSFEGDFVEAGSISQAEFTLDGERYTVEGVYQVFYTLDDGTRGPAMVLAISPPFTRDGWSFTVDGVTFIVDEARHEQYDEYPGLDFLSWRAPDLGWTEGQEVSVGLTVPQSVPVLPVPALGILLALLSATGIAARRRAIG